MIKPYSYLLYTFTLLKTINIASSIFAVPNTSNVFSVPVNSIANGQHDITLIVSKVESGNTYFYSWFGQFTKS